MGQNIRLSSLDLPFSLQSFPFFPFGQRQKCFPNSLQVCPLVHSTRQGFPTSTKVKRSYWMNESSANVLSGRAKNLLPQLFKSYIFTGWEIFSIWLGCSLEFLFWEKRFKVQDSSLKSCIVFLIVTWNWKVEIIFATVSLKIYILAISYHRLQHQGQEIELLSLRWALFYHRRCCCKSWLYRFKGLIVYLTMLVSG